MRMLTKNYEVKLREIIFEALGQASMCWEQRPVGVFDSTQAKAVGEEVVVKIDNLLADYASLTGR